jgi:Fe2+ or Zn2+ uptake regulation protein
MAEKMNADVVYAWLESLKQNGYRLTEPRQAVVETMAASPRILAPLDVFELARRRCPGLGLVTVYRTMEKLEELGCLQRVHQPSGCQGFVAAANGHQHLLICEQCGIVEYFSGDSEKMESLIDDVALKSGYQVREHWLQLFGRCENCSSGRDQA